MGSADADDRAASGPPTRFRLYVAGESPRSARAIQNLRYIMDTHLMGACEVEVIDVIASPHRAEEERILATPTLLREAPGPGRRVTGDLSDFESVLKVVAPDRVSGPIRRA